MSRVRYIVVKPHRRGWKVVDHTGFVYGIYGDWRRAHRRCIRLLKQKRRHS